MISRAESAPQGVREGNRVEAMAYRTASQRMKKFCININFLRLEQRVQRETSHAATAADNSLQATTSTTTFPSFPSIAAMAV